MTTKGSFRSYEDIVTSKSQFTIHNRIIIKEVAVHHTTLLPFIKNKLTEYPTKDDPRLTNPDSSNIQNFYRFSKHILINFY